jgi:hypothetical protein
LTFYEKGKDGKDVSNSFSGNERDHLYLNQQGKSFVDFSGLSGLDMISDGRSFAYLDYDHDGWLDIVVASANAPQLQLLHNEIAQSIAVSNNQVSIRLVGGNLTSNPSTHSTNRNAYGTKLFLALDNGQVLYREHSCGAGLAAQNSNTIHVGLGTATAIENLKIIWPSGKSQTIQNIQPGRVHEFREASE